MTEENVPNDYKSEILGIVEVYVIDVQAVSRVIQGKKDAALELRYATTLLWFDEKFPRAQAEEVREVLFKSLEEEGPEAPTSRTILEDYLRKYPERVLVFGKASNVEEVLSVIDQDQGQLGAMARQVILPRRIRLLNGWK